MHFDLAFGLGLGAAAVFASLGGLFLLAAVQGRNRPTHNSIFADTQRGTLFLFDGEDLIDCTAGGRALLAMAPPCGTAWAKLLAHLSAKFPEIESKLSLLQSEGSITLAAEEGNGPALLLQAELRGGLTRISLTDPETEAAVPGTDLMAHRAKTEELEFLRAAFDQAPVLAWRERDDGAVIWANAAYLMIAAQTLPQGQEISWPLPRIFEKTAIRQGVAGQRLSIRFTSGSTAWFDLTIVSESSGRRVYALPADAAVQAETNLSEFMQTLAKTFAHLPIGLAIFDRHRKLQLFNPAFLELTDLQPDFLTQRPALMAVLDTMREGNRVPEPTNYREWCRKLAEMDQSATTGIYEETWALPGGKIYRMVARPHSNGALALMLEDISSEISRMRRIRADLDLGQSVIDSMEEAVAVFSATGNLVMTNAAYAQLWGNDPAKTDDAQAGEEGSMAALSRQWRARSAPNPIWAEAEDFAATIGDREHWSGHARLLDGRMLICRFSPLSGGATLIGFRIAADKAEPAPRQKRKIRREA